MSLCLSLLRNILVDEIEISIDRNKMSSMNCPFMQTSQFLDRKPLEEQRRLNKSTALSSSVPSQQAPISWEEERNHAITAETRFLIASVELSEKKRGDEFVAVGLQMETGDERARR